MNTGYIKLYRKIGESIVWTNSDMLKLWVLCLTKATHTERKFLFNGQELQLDAGEFVTGRNVLAEEFNKGVKPKEKANERTLWRYMKRLEKEEMLSIKTTTKYSVISITNWSEYQQVSNECPAPVQRLSTYKNDKNDKKSNIGVSEQLRIDFEKLWSLYPKKQGSKKKALASYSKAIKSGTTNKEIQDGIIAYKKYLKREEWQKPANGETWFFNERWNNEYGTEMEQKKTDSLSLDEIMERDGVRE